MITAIKKRLRKIPVLWFPVLIFMLYKAELCYCMSEPDKYEEDDIFTQANIIIPSNSQLPQQHDFHKAGDTDWIKFSAISGKRYAVKAGDLGENCNVKLELYDTDGATRLEDPVDDNPYGCIGCDRSEEFSWLCSEDGVYFIKITQSNPDIFGENTEYEIIVFIPSGAFDAELTGYVRDKISGKGLVDVFIEIRNSNISRRDYSYNDLEESSVGKYWFPSLEPGEYDITANFEGYETFSGKVIVKSLKDNNNEPSEQDILMTPVDNTPPVCGIEYSAAELTNQNVTANLTKCSEDVIITNNNGALTYTFTENGEFTFEFKDKAGNTGTAAAAVSWIDKILPTATVSYFPDSITNQNVIATLNPSEDVTVTNNSGAFTYTFTENGEFTFEFKDIAGNIGKTTASVTWINNIGDAIEILQILTGYVKTVVKDRNGDGKISLEDAVYILQKISGIRN